MQYVTFSNWANLGLPRDLPATASLTWQEDLNQYPAVTRDPDTSDAAPPARWVGVYKAFPFLKQTELAVPNLSPWSLSCWLSHLLNPHPQWELQWERAADKSNTLSYKIPVNNARKLLQITNTAKRQHFLRFCQLFQRSVYVSSLPYNSLF